VQDTIAINALGSTKYRTPKLNPLYTWLSERLLERDISAPLYCPRYHG